MVELLLGEVVSVSYTGLVVRQGCGQGRRELGGRYVCPVSNQSEVSQQQHYYDTSVRLKCQLRGVRPLAYLLVMHNYIPGIK